MTTTNSIRFALTLSLAALVSACAGGSRDTATTVGSAGGTVTSASGVSLRVPAGALPGPTTLRIVEREPAEGELHRVELEPRGLALAVPAVVAFRVEDGNVVVSEIEHGPEGERHGVLEERHRGGEVEVEIEHLGEIEVEHGRVCDPGCGAGFECDDGVCKPHAEDDPTTHDIGDDNGIDDPATHDVGDDNGIDDPATHDVGDDNGGTAPGHP